MALIFVKSLTQVIWYTFVRLPSYSRRTYGFYYRLIEHILPIPPPNLCLLSVSVQADNNQSMALWHPSSTFPSRLGPTQTWVNIYKRLLPWYICGILYILIILNTWQWAGIVSAVPLDLDLIAFDTYVPFARYLICSKYKHLLTDISILHRDRANWYLPR